MNRYQWVKRFLIAASIIAGSGIGFYYWKSASVTSASGISAYQESRDARDIHALFKKDWYWLSARDYKYEQVDWMIKTGSPNEYDPEYFGKMKFKVMRDEQGKFVGFTAYYMKNFYNGAVLFLAVEPELRSKGYGLQLLTEAIKDLFAQGATVITLNVREDNTRGRAFYARAGFTEISNERGFIVVKMEKSK